MTVSSGYAPNSSTGNGVTTVFPYTFRILADADIEVTVDGVVKTLTTHYTVSGAGADAGGNVTFLTAPANGSRVVRRRKMALARTTNLTVDLQATVLNKDQDAPVLMLQQVQEEVDRSIKTGLGDTALQVLPVAADRASKYLGFDASGQPIAVAGTSGATLISAFGATLVDDANAAAARATLGAGAVGDSLFQAATAAAARAAIGGEIAAGQCRLTKSGANLLLSRLNGQWLMINGVWQSIPAAGVSLAPPATTLILYYIYAFMSGATMTLEASTTTHATDATTGVEIKSGDATRTLVGMARTVASAWVDSATQRFVVSYFNRREIPLKQAAVSVSSINTTDVERTTANRCEFLTWADEPVRFGSNGFIGNNVAASVNNNAGGSIDGAVGAYQPATHYSSAINSVGSIGWVMTDTLSEGYHFSSLNASTSTGSGGILSAQNWAVVRG